VIGRASTAALGAAAALCAVLTLNAAGPESFTATASVKKGGVSATAPVRVTVTQYSNDAERAAARKAVRDGGTAALRKLLVGRPDIGFIQIGDLRTPVKFAMERNTSNGRLITAITSEPILRLGGGVRTASPVEGFDVAVAMFEVQPDGPGVGDLSPAAKVGLEDEALVITDYGATVIWLNNIARAK
jgi:hypothetical protein